MGSELKSGRVTPSVNFGHSKTPIWAGCCTCDPRCSENRAGPWPPVVETQLLRTQQHPAVTGGALVQSRCQILLFILALKVLDTKPKKFGNKTNHWRILIYPPYDSSILLDTSVMLEPAWRKHQDTVPALEFTCFDVSPSSSSVFVSKHQTRRLWRYLPN